MKSLLRIYWFASLATLAIWILVGWQLGLAVLFTVFVLTLLEVTFSADNAVINSRVIMKMSPMWQKLFLTIGIFTAVFVVRFILPLVIVMITSGLGWSEVTQLVTTDTAGYAAHLHQAEPMINAFGGTFLLMIALSYFIDNRKTLHWFRPLERRLAKLGQFDNFTVFIMLVGIATIFFTVDPAHHAVVLPAMILAVTLHVGLKLLGAIMENRQKSARNVNHLVGGAALSAFIYLEILDASFSLDSVIGAFAMTNNVLLIMAGLGAGALWVRGMTIHLVRQNTLKHFKFLEHGAHWAIAFLGGVMMAKLYSVELPEWIIGSLGIIIITLALWWSQRDR
ncbi:DUF475 domain-containing protein [Candidatus Saccharibacteria bacterium]|nr:DUF475 domain-containing protein [Candidatus Saccharibacteria bacterium]